jgi:hypothetical protein
MDIQSGAQPEPFIEWRGVRMSEQFVNLRAQMWWQARIDLQFPDESGIILPYDEELFVDLSTPRWTNRKGKIIVEEKEEIKRRIGRSPNKGDAFVYWNWVRMRRRSSKYRFGIISGVEHGMA